jgi:hypothetical protein
MEENEIISVESLNTFRSKKSFSSNGGKSNNSYCDFVYNIDEILKLDDTNNNSNNKYNDKISLNNYRENVINSFKLNKINAIQRTMTLNNIYNKNKNNIIKNSKTINFINNLNKKNEYKINTNIYINNSNDNKIKNSNNYINKNINNNMNNKSNEINNSNNNNIKNDVNNEKIIKNINKLKSITSEIMTDIEIEELSNRNNIPNNIIKLIENKKTNNINFNCEEKKNNIDNEDEDNMNNIMSYPDLYNKIENQINTIKKSKKQKGKNLIESNKKIIELLSKINCLYNLSEDDGKYKTIFKQILDKIIYYFNNKNSIEIMNLFTEIKEKQSINISFKKEYQKLINSRPFKEKSFIDERKNMEYKENLKIYEELNNKILKMEKRLEYLKQKLNLYKEQEKNENIQKYIGNKGDYEVYELKQSLLTYNNTINKLKEDINAKEKELNFLNNNNNISYSQ